MRERSTVTAQSQQRSTPGGGEGAASDKSNARAHRDWISDDPTKVKHMPHFADRMRGQGVDDGPRGGVKGSTHKLSPVQLVLYRLADYTAKAIDVAHAGGFKLKGKGANEVNYAQMFSTMDLDQN